MEKAITPGYLAVSNLKKKPFRTAALIAVIALSSAVLLGSLIFTSSLKSGIYGIQSRLGADLMIVPEGSEQKMESVLLYGTPNYFYMDKSIEEVIRGVDGVQLASSQVYLASVSESCCDFPIQIIGFDPATDFIVKSWSRKKIAETGGNAGLRVVRADFDRDHAFGPGVEQEIDKRALVRGRSGAACRTVDISGRTRASDRAHFISGRVAGRRGSGLRLRDAGRVAQHALECADVLRFQRLSAARNVEERVRFAGVELHVRNQRDDVRAGLRVGVDIETPVIRFAFHHHVAVGPGQNGGRAVFLQV